MPLAITQSDLTEWWAPALAFVAGIVSFASPCVFPLVPGYVSFVTGGRAAQDDGRPLAPILLFIAGFGLVFTLLGAFSSLLVPKIGGVTGQRIAGVVVVLVGALMIVYALGRGSVRLYAEHRPFLQKVRPGPAWAAPLGMAFALGWTPCIGPVLGAILAIASTQGGAFRGGGLLFLYSLGLGLPFVLIGLGVQRLVRVLDVIKRNYHWIAGVSGAIMVAIGVLLVSGLWQSWVTPWLNRLSSVTPPL
jgi:cytochrome c-type biogenesis protein